MTPLTRPQMAWRVARDIPDGATVNLGIGMPDMVSNHLPDDRDIVFHCENGILGMGPMPREGEEDFDVITAGKKPVTVIPGAAYFDSADSFAMIRGGHIDIAVLGAYQVSAAGDLANWSMGDGGGTAEREPAVGGAMDLALGARTVFALTEHTTKAGAPKLVDACTYPLTGRWCVTRVFTDLAAIDVTDQGFVVREMIAGLALDDLQARTGAPLVVADNCKVLDAPEGLAG